VQLRAIDQFARRHHGLITRERASTLGVGRSGWYRAIESGMLEQLYPGVARVWGSPTTSSQRALAAVWAAGDGAMASHRTAAWLWGVERRPNEPIDIIVPSRARMPRTPDVVVHRPRDVKDLRPIVRKGIPTTDPMRMLLDLGAVDPRAVNGALMSVLASKVASPAAIRGALARHAKKGRHGVVALRAALEQLADDELPPDSELEARMFALLKDHALPAVEFHASIEGFEVDFLVVGTPVIIECDGWGPHGLDRDQFEFDRIRNAVLTAAGYVIVHITWRQLVNDPVGVATRVSNVVRRWTVSATPR
jgi:very-short-patch-repair endonuclease